MINLSRVTRDSSPGTTNHQIQLNGHCVGPRSTSYQVGWSVFCGNIQELCDPEHAYIRIGLQSHQLLKIFQNAGANMLRVTFIKWIQALAKAIILSFWAKYFHFQFTCYFGGKEFPPQLPFQAIVSERFWFRHSPGCQQVINRTNPYQHKKCMEEHPNKKKRQTKKHLTGLNDQ